jgi:pyruvate dehydrogenase E2 component (dihydrolipoamide acetyltransferase)
MPRLSDTMDKGTVAHWKKHPGDHVSRGEVLLEIETDKANMELEAYSDGILATILVDEGETAPVGAPIGMVATDEAELKSLQASSGRGDNAAVHTKEPASKTGTATPERDQLNGSSPHPLVEETNGRVKASPLARRIAKQRGIDLNAVTGTGPGGRIVREDVEAAPNNTAPAKPSKSTQEVRSATRPAAVADGERIPLTRMQQTVANRLTESAGTVPHFFVTSEIDMTHAVRMRLQISEAEPDLKVSFNDIILRACAVTLTEFPQLNSRYDDGAIVRNADVNIGIAVDLPGGLIVPVLKRAQVKSLRQITAETKSLVTAAREAKLKPDNFEGGTFTISNLGMFGVDQFTAIINPPESAILAVGAIREKPAVVNGEVAVRSLMRVTLSCDHRLVYGADGAAFLAGLRRTLEHPVLALL